MHINTYLDKKHCIRNDLSPFQYKAENNVMNNLMHFLRCLNHCVGNDSHYLFVQYLLN